MPNQSAPRYVMGRKILFLLNPNIYIQRINSKLSKMLVQQKQVYELIIKQIWYMDSLILPH
jgi:hypothetical protein